MENVSIPLGNSIDIFTSFDRSRLFAARKWEFNEVGEKKRRQEVYRVEVVTRAPRVVAFSANEIFVFPVIGRSIRKKCRMEKI